MGDVFVAKVDATQHRVVSNAFNIMGYPSIILIKDSKVFIFRGKRTHEEFAMFAAHGWKDQQGQAFPMKVHFDEARLAAEQEKVAWGPWVWALIIVGFFGVFVALWFACSERLCGGGQKKTPSNSALGGASRVAGQLRSERTPNMGA